MSKTEINLALATALEPNAQDIPCDERKWHGTRAWQDSNGFMHYDPIPLDFFTDAWAQWMLLEAMPGSQLQKLTDGEYANQWWCTALVVVTKEAYECDQEDYPHGWAHNPDRATAIILAACRWKGLEATLD